MRSRHTIFFQKSDILCPFVKGITSNISITPIGNSSRSRTKLIPNGNSSSTLFSSSLNLKRSTGKSVQKVLRKRHVDKLKRNKQEQKSRRKSIYVFGRTYLKFPLILGSFRLSAVLWRSWGIPLVFLFWGLFVCRGDLIVEVFSSGNFGSRGVSESLPLFPI